MRAVYTLVLIVACHFVKSTGFAQISFSDIWGYSKTLYNNVHSFIGTTTVTPAYALLDWREDLYGYYSNVYISHKWRFNRSMITGAQFYEHRQLKADGTWASSSEPFSISTVQRLDYYCDNSTVDVSGAPLRFSTTRVREFHVAVWISNLNKTGYMPPSQPFTVQLKSTASGIPYNCEGTIEPSRETRRSVSVNDTGYVVTSMPMVNYDYSWPMLCWVGGTYDY